jgi:hypothetical protein
MPFSVSADAIFDGFKSSIRQNNGPVWLQPHGIEAAAFVAYQPPDWVTSDGSDRPLNPVVTTVFLVNAVQTSQGTNTQVLEKLSRDEMRNFFDFVGQNSVNAYRNVTTNNLWRQLYGVRSKQYDTYDSKANQKGTAMHDATYCQRCGIILPLRNLTIDHQKPQKGGEVQAMLRVFRAAGLTRSTGSGTKNRFLQGQIAQTVGGNQTVLQRGQRGGDVDRYSLSSKGIIYFTLLQHWNLAGEMLQMSMHHIANLRPMCGPCNSSLRNTNVIAFI